MKIIIQVSAFLMLAAFMTVCNQKSNEVYSELDRQVALGERVFVEKKCGECHTTIGDFDKSENEAPDLASVFLAMDTMFVRTHLQFTELSEMPGIEMTPHEISAVTQYIANLHAKAHTVSNLIDPDGICPVCRAPLQKSEAEANHLKITYQGREFYFECPDCKVVFLRDPSWYARMLEHTAKPDPS